MVLYGGLALLRIVSTHWLLEDAKLEFLVGTKNILKNFTFASPRVGDWVLGFFMDGEQAQMPIMLGILPGLKPAKTNQPYETDEEAPAPFEYSPFQVGA